MRLAAELDEARFYRAAAYAAMVTDAIDQKADDTAEAEDIRSDADLDFELDEHGRVWMIREGECNIIGSFNTVCAGMRRFLRTAPEG